MFTEIFPPLILKPTYVCARAMPRAKIYQLKVPTFKKTTGLYPYMADLLYSAHDPEEVEAGQLLQLLHSPGVRGQEGREEGWIRGHVLQALRHPTHHHKHSISSSVNYTCCSPSPPPSHLHHLDIVFRKYEVMDCTELFKYAVFKGTVPRDFGHFFKLCRLLTDLKGTIRWKRYSVRLQ